MCRQPRLQRLDVLCIRPVLLLQLFVRNHFTACDSVLEVGVAVLRQSKREEDRHRLFFVLRHDGIHHQSVVREARLIGKGRNAVEKYLAIGHMASFDSLQMSVNDRRDACARFP